MFRGSIFDLANMSAPFIRVASNRTKIRKEREQVEALFDSFVAENPVKARGYIRNNYIIYSKGNNR